MLPIFRASPGAELREGTGEELPAVPLASPSILRNYAELTKPRLLPLVLMTGLPALYLSGGGAPAPAFAALVMLGIALAAASANTLNAYIERDKDALMARTKDRPLPAGRMAPGAALLFGLVLAVVSTLLLLAVSGPAAAGLGVASIAFYVFVYTLWLKPRSDQNIVIGGAAGAVPVLVGWAAVTGSLAAPAWLMFAIIFLWTPPRSPS